MKLLKSVLLILTLSCGGPLETSRAVLHASTEAVVTVDKISAEQYQKQAAAALLAAATKAEYDTIMLPLNTVEQSLRVARDSLLALQAGLDAWENGNKGAWDAALPCMLLALSSLSVALESAGISPPDSVAEALQLGATLAGNLRCGV